MVRFAPIAAEKMEGGLFFSPCKLLNVISNHLQKWCHNVYILYFQTHKLDADEQNVKQ